MIPQEQPLTFAVKKSFSLASVENTVDLPLCILAELSHNYAALSSKVSLLNGMFHPTHHTEMVKHS